MERYDHCCEYSKELQILIVYGGRNHKMYEVTGKIAFSDIHVLNLKNLTWNEVSVPDKSSIERYLFNSFVFGRLFSSR